MINYTNGWGLRPWEDALATTEPPLLTVSYTITHPTFVSILYIQWNLQISNFRECDTTSLERTRLNVSNVHFPIYTYRTSEEPLYKGQKWLVPTYLLFRGSTEYHIIPTTHWGNISIQPGHSIINLWPLDTWI